MLDELVPFLYYPISEPIFTHNDIHYVTVLEGNTQIQGSNMHLLRISTTNTNIDCVLSNININKNTYMIPFLVLLPTLRILQQLSILPNLMLMTVPYIF